MLNTLQMPDSAHWIIVGPMSSTEAPLIRNVLIQIHRCKPMPTRTAKAVRHPRSLKVSRRSLLPWCRLLIQILDWKSHICQRKMHLPNWSFSKSTTVFFKHIFFFEVDSWSVLFFLNMFWIRCSLIRFPDPCLNATFDTLQAPTATDAPSVFESAPAERQGPWRWLIWENRSKKKRLKNLNF